MSISNTRRLDMNQARAIQKSDVDVKQEGFRPYRLCACGKMFQDFTVFVGYFPYWEHALAEVCPDCGRDSSSRKAISVARRYINIKSRGFFGGRRTQKQLLPMDQSAFVERS